MAKVGLNLGLNRCLQTTKNHKNKKGSYFRSYLIQRAENGTQTRDPQLGRLVLYRLSYFRRLLFIRQLQKILFSLFRLVDVSVDVCVKPDRVYILS